MSQTSAEQVSRQGTSQVSHMEAALPTYRRTFPGLPEEVRKARRFASQCLAGSATAEQVCLMVSELATNALRHSRSGHRNGHFTITITVGADHARVEVADQGSHTGSVPHLAPSSAEDESSRGLAIVEALADEWGTQNPSTVWFEVNWSPVRSFA